MEVITSTGAYSNNDPDRKVNRIVNVHLRTSHRVHPTKGKEFFSSLNRSEIKNLFSWASQKSPFNNS